MKNNRSEAFDNLSATIQHLKDDERVVQVMTVVVNKTREPFETASGGKMIGVTYALYDIGILATNTEQTVKLLRDIIEQMERDMEADKIEKLN